MTRARARARDKPSLFIIEDHPLMREGLLSYFAATRRWRTLGSASSSAEAVAFFAARPEVPDIILLDIHLQEDYGLDLIPLLTARLAKSPFWAVYSGFDDYALVNAAVSLGVRAFVGKRRTPEELEAALVSVLQGKTHIDQDVDTRFRLVSDGINLLTPRESEIFSLVKKGLSNRQIADLLDISRRTVENILSCVYDKLGVRSREGLLRL